MKDTIKNRELPLGVQYAALSAAWLTWLAAVAWVIWRAHENARLGRTFADPLLIYFLLMVGFPLVLTLAGLAFVRRLGSPTGLPFVQRLCYRVLVVLTAIAAAVVILWLVALGAACLGPTIRE